MEVVVGQSDFNRSAGSSVTGDIVDVSAGDVEYSSTAVVGYEHFSSVYSVLTTVHPVVDHDEVDVVVVFQVHLPPHVLV